MRLNFEFVFVSLEFEMYFYDIKNYRNFNSNVLKIFAFIEKKSKLPILYTYILLYVILNALRLKNAISDSFALQ